MKAVLVSVLGVAMLAGCASKSNEISAKPVPTALYDHMSCEEITRETMRVHAEVNTVAGEQDSRATSDAVATTVGIVLFWPALFFLASDDDADKLAQLKGEFEALQLVSTKKGC